MAGAKARIAATDRQIDRLADELCGLTEGEIERQWSFPVRE